MYIVANSLRTARSSVASVPGRANLVTNPLGGVKRGLESCMDDDDATVGDMYRASKAARSQDDVAAEADGDAALNVIADAGLETVPWLVSSLCPLIFGHELVKLGLLLGLFGGTPRDAYVGKHDEATGSTFSTRSDIHVLVVGDPGLGKSQLLRAATAVAPKAVFVCGNTATTAGLTVSLSRDTGGGRGGDVCIEAGALVLADRGVCCIDELDKMTCDPHSMLEAMEQQQISVAKSGVVTSLKSRATILAAANPVGGHYNRNKSVTIDAIGIQSSHAIYND